MVLFSVLILNRTTVTTGEAYLCRIVMERRVLVIGRFCLTFCLAGYSHIGHRNRKLDSEQVLYHKWLHSLV